jgi:hypothetical protein
LERTTIGSFSPRLAHPHLFFPEAQQENENGSAKTSAAKTGGLPMK